MRGVQARQFVRHCHLTHSDPPFVDHSTHTHVPSGLRVVSTHAHPVAEAASGKMYVWHSIYIARRCTPTQDAGALLATDSLDGCKAFLYPRVFIVVY